MKIRVLSLIFLVFCTSISMAQEEKSLEEKRDDIDLINFLELEIVNGENAANFLEFYESSEKFPELDLRSPVTAEKFLGGDYTISTRWFDADLNEMEKPGNPGRYAYYAEITGDNGLVMRKSATLFCSPKDWSAWTEQIKANVEYFPFDGIEQDVWVANGGPLADYAGEIILKSIFEADMGPVLLSYLHDMNRKGLRPSPNNTPLIMDGDYHARLKQKILNTEGKYNQLAPPKRIEESSTTLSYLSRRERKPYAKFVKALNEFCDEWAEGGGEPFDLLIAKDGNIVFHDAFGENMRGEFTTEVSTEVASITKLFTGITFAQFVDQGIMQIDDKVGQYLPDFPLDGDSAITMRQCFAHTTGLWGHSSLGGVPNPWLDNSIALWLPYLDVGANLIYNGDGYNLAGKVMEVVAGRSIFRVMNEQLIQPLGLKNTYLDNDLAFGTKSTAYDLAVIGQMMLNKGKYGDVQLFSEETYNQMMPVDLNKYFPKITDIEWGIGITQMNAHLKDEANSKERVILSDEIYGHGSATASILQFDTKNNIVIGQSRMSPGKDNYEYYKRMLLIIEEYLVN